jgi:hypothetical protein
MSHELHKGRYLLLVTSGTEVMKREEYDSPDGLHSAWYYWSNCRDSQGFPTYTVRCWQEIDPKELPL